MSVYGVKCESNGCKYCKDGECKSELEITINAVCICDDFWEED